MSTSTELLAQAHRHIDARQWPQAATKFAQLLQHEPTQFDAHHFLWQWTMQQQQWSQALFHAEQTLASKNDDVALHQLLAQTLQQVLNTDNGEQHCQHLLQQLPQAFTTRLAYGCWLEQAQQLELAAKHYLRASKDAQAQGFWQDDASTPPWLRQRVKSAMQFVARFRHQLFEQLLTPLLQQFGRDDMQRVQHCIAMYLGEQALQFADARQRPSFLYFPTLPVNPIFDRKLFPWAEWLEAQTDSIRDEMFNVLGSADVEAFHHYDSPEQAEHLFTGASWDAYFFYRHGAAYEHHLSNCPHTASVLKQLPQVMIREHAPETCYSILRPGTHILPHRGVSNVRSVLHLPLVLPGHCVLNVIDAHCHEWQMNQCFAFDDTFEHEAWNRSTQTRVILLTDIWNPYLRDAERLAMKQVIEAIGDFNRELETK